MRYILKIATLFSFASILLFACKKDNSLPSYGIGITPVLSASSTNVIPTEADSSNVVLTFNWTDPKFTTDSANTKYVLEIDSTGKSFTNPYRVTLIGMRTQSFTGKQINDLILNTFGWMFNVPYSFDARVVASYVNNNDMKMSNTLKFMATGYKVKPKVDLPAAGRLFIVGALNGWNNSTSLDVGKYEFSRITETIFEGIFQFSAGDNFKLIQDLGNWGTQYHMIDGGTSTSGSFEQKDADPAFNIGTNGGWFRVIVDFQKGTYKIESAPVRVAMPAELYLVGAINSWDNSPTLDPKYKFTKTSSFQHTLSINVPAGGSNFKLIQNLGNWGTQFHKLSGDAASGELEQKDADPAFDLPVTAGMYKLVCDFATNKYWLTKL